MYFEKVNPSHPDKVADRIAGAIVDLAYKKQGNPKIAVEVLIGHGVCHTIIETSADILPLQVAEIVERIAGAGIECDTKIVPQDEHLAKNQSEEIRCGDNGIFRGVPTNSAEQKLTEVVRELYQYYPTDGKFIIYVDDESEQIIACQSNADGAKLKEHLAEWFDVVTVNPLGDWTGGTNVDTGATNRKLGSDMGRAVTGGGLHGKDLSKADVSINICAATMANLRNQPINAHCAIGDTKVRFETDEGETVCVMSYGDIVKSAREHIEDLGGFEKFAEWGLI